MTSCRILKLELDVNPCANCNVSITIIYNVHFNQRNWDNYFCNIYMLGVHICLLYTSDAADE